MDAMRQAVLWLCLCATGVAAEGPRLTAGDIVNAADYRGGGVTPGEIVVLFPSGAGPAAMAAWDLKDDGEHASPIGETRVLFDGAAASLVYAVKGQVAAVVPFEVARRKETRIVLEYQGVQSTAVTLPVISSAPALFTLDASGKGQAALLNETGCCNSVRNPAPQGSVVSLYATGDGQTAPWDGPARSRLPLSVTVGGLTAEILDVRNVGVLQVNFRVPAAAPVGDAVPLALAVSDVKSSSPVTMAVRSSRRRILIVSPDQAVGEWVEAVLRGSPYDVEVARESGQALTSAREHPADLLISDLAITEAEQTQMLQALKQKRPKVKLLALSQSLDSGSLRAADMLGAQAVLCKPLKAKQVRARVATLLHERAAHY